MGEIYLVRHAQASFNSEDYDALSPIGRKQAKILAGYLAQGVKADFIFSGSMRRHLDTAAAYDEMLEPKAGLIVEPGFNEFNHQDIIAKLNPKWQERRDFKAFLDSHEAPKKMFIEVFLKALARWMAGDNDGEYAESWPVFSQRVIDAFETIKRKAGPSKTSVVFTSGGPISLLCLHFLALGTPAMLDINRSLVNTGVTRILYSGEKSSLSYLNNYTHIEHLENDLLTLI